MKKIVSLMCLVFVAQGALSQPSDSPAVIHTEFADTMEALFAPLEKSYVPHGILLDYGIDFVDVAAFDGSIKDSVYTDLSVLQRIYHTLLSSRISEDATEGFVTPQQFSERLWSSRKKANEGYSGVIVLTGLYFKYAKFVDSAKNRRQLNYIKYKGGQLYDKYKRGVWKDPYETRQTFAMAPAINAYRGLEIAVKIPSDIFYSNVNDEIERIEVDFDDGRGFREVSSPFSVSPIQFKGNLPHLPVRYDQAGIKTWRYRLTLKDGSSLYSRSRIKITSSGFAQRTAPTSNSSQNSISPSFDNMVDKIASQQFSPPPSGGVRDTLYGGVLDTLTLVADTSYKDKKGRVKITVHYTGTTKVIKNPLIVVEGYDRGVALKPEQKNGDRDYSSFRESVLASNSTLLKDLIYNSQRKYDIIYVNWYNGVDYMQRNAYALEKVIKWVNLNKAGSTTKNVVLGQSMGGVIARYALTDMEKHGLKHDTRLFISHDAPHQGANVPVSLQLMARHLTSLGIKVATGLRFIDKVVAPLVATPFAEPYIPDLAPSVYGPLNMISILDAPASRQLLKNFVNVYSRIDNKMHNDFFAELRGLGNGGYPKDSIRNIAISNGSECGSDQGFKAGDDLIRVNADAGHKGNPITSLLHAMVTYVGSQLFFNPRLFVVSVLSTIPGSARYDAEFWAKSIPLVQEQIYRGYLAYTKYILWFIRVRVTLFNVRKYSPESILPFDNYGGGSFSLKGSDVSLNGGGSSSFLTADYNYDISLSDQFCFIPTPSALDIGGKNNVKLAHEDYVRGYSGGYRDRNSPKDSPFDNFSTEFDATQVVDRNEKHISFSLRNGDWLASELNEDPNTTDCGAFCRNSLVSKDISISGPSEICQSGAYRLKRSDRIRLTGMPQWSINPSESGLVSLSNPYGYTTRLSRQLAPNLTRVIDLQAEVGISCTQASYIATKKVRLQKPPQIEFPSDALTKLLLQHAPSGTAPADSSAIWPFDWSNARDVVVDDNIILNDQSLSIKLNTGGRHRIRWKNNRLSLELYIPPPPDTTPTTPKRYLPCDNSGENDPRRPECIEEEPVPVEDVLGVPTHLSLDLPTQRFNFYWPLDISYQRYPFDWTSVPAYVGVGSNVIPCSGKLCWLMETLSRDEYEEEITKDLTGKILMGSTLKRKVSLLGGKEFSDEEPLTHTDIHRKYHTGEPLLAKSIGKETLLMNEEVIGYVLQKRGLVGRISAIPRISDQDYRFKIKLYAQDTILYYLPQSMYRYFPYRHCLSAPIINSVAGKYDLIDHYFVVKNRYYTSDLFLNNDLPIEKFYDYYPRTIKPVPNNSINSPPIRVSEPGIVEVEVTVSNLCGCDTKMNTYLVLPEQQPANAFNTPVSVIPDENDNDTSFETSSNPASVVPDANDDDALFNMSPNPADNTLQITVIAPQRKNEVHFENQPEIIGSANDGPIMLGEDNFVPIETIPVDDKFFDYQIEIYNSHTGSVMYATSFRLVDRANNALSNKKIMSNKKITIDTSTYPEGLYIVRVKSLTENSEQLKRLVIQH